jgi:hypothetical protein
MKHLRCKNTAHDSRTSLLWSIAACPSSMQPSGHLLAVRKHAARNHLPESYHQPFSAQPVSLQHGTQIDMHRQVVDRLEEALQAPGK